MKPLLPTLRERKRYLVFEIVSGSEKYVDTKIISAYKTLFGEVGLSEAGLQFIEVGKKGIIRVNHNKTEQLKAALVYVKKPQLQSIGISGILKKAKTKYLEGEKNATDVTSNDGL